MQMLTDKRQGTDGVDLTYSSVFNINAGVSADAVAGSNTQQTDSAATAYGIELNIEAYSGPHPLDL